MAKHSEGKRFKQENKHAKKMNNVKFRHILHYYIESGIPVALGLKLGEENKHSVINIGYKVPETSELGRELTCAYDQDSKNILWICDTADIVDTYCIMDDNRVPYKISKCEILQNRYFCSTIKKHGMG